MRIWFGLVFWHINHCRLFNAKSSLCIYIKYIWFGLVWFGLVSWHINNYRLFNTKSSCYIYWMDMIWFGLVWFYGISTIAGYLILNPLYTYLLNIYDFVWFGLVWFHGISVTLWRGALSRRSFCLFWRETKQRPDATGNGQGNASQRVGKRNSVKELGKAVGEGWRRRAVDNGQQKEAMREGQSGGVGIPSSFVEISLEIHASVSLQMHRKCSVT